MTISGVQSALELITSFVVQSGAEVIVIDRGPVNEPLYHKDMSRRGKKSIVVNLKSEEGKETLLKLIASADVLIEGFRPGVTE